MNFTFHITVSVNQGLFSLVTVRERNIWSEKRFFKCQSELTSLVWKKEKVTKHRRRQRNVKKKKLASETSQSCQSDRENVAVLAEPVGEYFVLHHSRVQEDHPIMSFTVSKNGRLALLNVATQVSRSSCFTPQCTNGTNIPVFSVQQAVLLAPWSSFPAS